MLRDHLDPRGLSWLDLRALVNYPRPGSALTQAMDPEWHVTPDQMFLRDLAFMVRRFLWDGTHPAPEPVLLTQAERDAFEAAKPPKADLMTPDEAIASLGLSNLTREVPDGR